MLLEGNVSVKAALLGQKRKVECVYIDETKHDRDTHFIEQKAKELNIPVEKKKRSDIDEMASGRTHGGVLATALGRNGQTIEDCLKVDNPFIACVEGVEDPFNLGYIVRTLYAAGCNGLIIPDRNWDQAESVILKSSAGAYEYLNIVRTSCPENELSVCKEKGLMIFAAMRKDAISYFDADFRHPAVICIGGEMRGLSKGVLKVCDQNIYIPYANDFRNALNAAGASAAIGFEVFRQRSENKG